MQLIVSQIFLICTSLSGWLIISISWFVLLQRYRRILNTRRHAAAWFVVLWAVSGIVAYSTFFECREVYSLSVYLGCLLYNFSVMAFGCHIIWRLVIKRKARQMLKPDKPSCINPPVNASEPKEERQDILTEEQEEAVHNWITSPEQIKSKMTLEKMSDDLMINKSVLSAYVIRKYGNTFPNVVKDIRLDRAEELLLSPYATHQSIIEILEESGFQAPSTFFRAFYERHNMPPTAWKKQKIRESCSEKDS